MVWNVGIMWLEWLSSHASCSHPTARQVLSVVVSFSVHPALCVLAGWFKTEASNRIHFLSLPLTHQPRWSSIRHPYADHGPSWSSLNRLRPSQAVPTSSVRTMLVVASQGSMHCPCMNHVLSCSIIHNACPWLGEFLNRNPCVGPHKCANNEVCTLLP